jgi:hypothetical protein
MKPSLASESCTDFLMPSGVVGVSVNKRELKRNPTERLTAACGDLRRLSARPFQWETGQTHSLLSPKHPCVRLRQP